VACEDVGPLEAQWNAPEQITPGSAVTKLFAHLKRLVGRKRHDIPDYEQRIRDVAYFKWEQAGRPEGDGSVFWKEAERECVTTSGSST